MITGNTVLRWALAAALWAAGWAALLLLDHRLELANLALLLVMVSALASVCLPVVAALASGAIAVAAFNWQFVPPRGSFEVATNQHLLLLAAMLGVNWLVAALVAGQRRQAERARHHLQQAEQLRAFSEALRDSREPLAHAAVLQQALQDLLHDLIDGDTGGRCSLLLLKGALPKQPDDDAVLQLGGANADERAGLWHCLRQRQPMGPGTGHHQELPAWYLPLRGRDSCHGAALLRLDETTDHPLARRHAQALCDQMGQALQRVQSQAAEDQARELAQLQAVRNAMLAAISHDFRTPLATILGAASSLQEQADRLQPAQRQRLADTIADEARQLSRLADNTLQLARLDAPGLALRLDWESAEEIVGEALRRGRRHDPQRRLRARLEPGLPLLRCDALLMAQLLDNLIDNALKYSPPDAPVEVLVRRQGAQVLIAVRDRGPGVPPAWRERIFDVFQRGETLATVPAGAGVPADQARPGAGVGLAVCRAIVRAHGSELKLRARAHGGCSFEFCLSELMDSQAEAAA